VVGSIIVMNALFLKTIHKKGEAWRWEGGMM
jgi:hypothetical protein